VKDIGGLWMQLMILSVQCLCSLCRGEAEFSGCQKHRMENGDIWAFRYWLTK